MKNTIKVNSEGIGLRHWKKVQKELRRCVKTRALFSLQRFIPRLASEPQFEVLSKNARNTSCKGVSKVYFHFLSQASPLSSSLCPNNLISPLFISCIVFPNTLFFFFQSLDLCCLCNIEAYTSAPREISQLLQLKHANGL